MPSKFQSILVLALAAGVSCLSAAEVLPPMVVHGEALTPGALAEEVASGAWGQPEWVQSRRFATTRVHIQRSPGEVALEQWWRGRMKDGKFSHRFQEEIEFGLPGRIQIDLYQDWTVVENKAEHLDFAAEIRWAPADWGVIPLNPALYLEYKWTDNDRGGDVIEPKLLLGDEFWPGVHWGLNLVYERELSGEEQAEEFQVTQGISWTVIDEKLSLGMEMKYVNETTKESRSDAEHKFLLGPSIQWRPTHNTHLDVVTLAGLTKESPDMEAWVVFGIDFDFGSGTKQKKGHGPVSGMR
jgi:hypothetical protein